MKLRLTVQITYDTGDDKTTLQEYGTLDPEECAEIDQDNFVGTLSMVGELVESHFDSMNDHNFIRVEGVR